MNNEVKVYTPEIVADSAFPTTGEMAFQESSGQSTRIAQDTFGAKETAEKGFPLKLVAKELLSTAINTMTQKIVKTFEFVKQGAIQIGEYINGVSGDIRISPDGITARNKSGITTFSIDGDTGDAIFSGDVRAATFTSDYFRVDNKGNVLARSIRFLNQESSVKEDVAGFMNITSSGSYAETPPYDPELAFSDPNPTLVNDIEVKIDLLNESYVQFDMTLEIDINQTAAQAAVSKTFWYMCTFLIVEIKNGTYETVGGYPINAITGGTVLTDSRQPTDNSIIYVSVDYRADGTAYPYGYIGYATNIYPTISKLRTSIIGKIDAGEHIYKILALPITVRHDTTWDSEAQLTLLGARLSVHTLGSV